MEILPESSEMTRLLQQLQAMQHIESEISYHLADDLFGL